MARSLTVAARVKLGSSGKCAHHDPGGVVAISRWLSAATPPVAVALKRNDPGRGRSHRRRSEWTRILSISMDTAATPIGVEAAFGQRPGGVAALNHRLTAGTPPGSILAGCAPFPDEPQITIELPISTLRSAASRAVRSDSPTPRWRMAWMLLPAPGERLHHARVPLRARTLIDAGLLHFADREGVAVRAVGAHGVVGVGDGQDAGQQGDRLAGQAVRVALAVPALVVDTARRAAGCGSASGRPGSCSRWSRAA